MTMGAKRRATDGRKSIYDERGHSIALLSATRSEWEGALLAECERGHVYMLPTDVEQWVSADAACPRCRALGHV